MRKTLLPTIRLLLKCYTNNNYEIAMLVPSLLITLKINMYFLRYLLQLPSWMITSMIRRFYELWNFHHFYNVEDGNRKIKFICYALLCIGLFTIDCGHLITQVCCVAPKFPFVQHYLWMKLSIETSYLMRTNIVKKKNSELLKQHQLLYAFLFNYKWKTSFPV